MHIVQKLKKNAENSKKTYNSKLLPENSRKEKSHQVSSRANLLETIH